MKQKNKTVREGRILDSVAREGRYKSIDAEARREQEVSQAGISLTLSHYAHSSPEPPTYQGPPSLHAFVVGPPTPPVETEPSVPSLNITSSVTPS